MHAGQSLLLLCPINPRHIFPGGEAGGAARTDVDVAERVIDFGKDLLTFCVVETHRLPIELQCSFAGTQSIMFIN